MSVTASLKAPTGLKAVLFSRTIKYRHASIPALIDSVRALFKDSQSSLITTEDPAELAAALPQVDVLIFADNTGDTLPGSTERAAIKTFINKGGSILGIHACTCGEPEWSWYGQLMGALFDGHPVPQWGLVTVKEPEHFITNGIVSPPPKGPAPAPECPQHLLEKQALPNVFPWFDEWYNFKGPKGPMDGNGEGLGPANRTDLLTVDESTYSGGEAGAYHPVAWTQEVESSSSRLFYTSLGHFDEAFTNCWFMTMIERGLYWVTRREREHSL